MPSGSGDRWARLATSDAHGLYRKYGFTTVSTRRGYYSDNGENALVMWAGNLKGELYGARLRVLRAALDTEILQRPSTPPPRAQGDRYKG